MDDQRHSDRDLRRNEDPEVIAGAVTGAAGVGAGAALGLAALGPLGAVAGALAGAVGGWWAGKGLERGVEDLDRAEDRFRTAHERAGAIRPYTEARHGYRLGWLAGRNHDYAGLPFEKVEPDLRDAWVQAHLHDRDPVSWEDVRDTAQTGYALARDDA
jgi:hypothetical protein